MRNRFYHHARLVFRQRSDDVVAHALVVDDASLSVGAAYRVKNLGVMILARSMFGSAYQHVYTCISTLPASYSISMQ